MSLGDPVNTSPPSPTEKSLAASVELLVTALEEVTEFSKKELKVYALLKHDPILWNLFLKHIIPLKKHVSRKHVKELLAALKSVNNAIASINSGKELEEKRKWHLFGGRNQY